MAVPINEDVCRHCGAEWSDNNPLKVCSCGKGLVCRICERNRCPDFSDNMLPNGTHCKELLKRESYQYRLLARKIDVSTEKAKAAAAKYNGMLTGDLFRLFLDTASRYKIDVKAGRGEEVAVELAAMQYILKDRTLSDSRTAKLYYRLSGEGQAIG